VSPALDTNDATSFDVHHAGGFNCFTFRNWFASVKLRWQITQLTAEPIGKNRCQPVGQAYSLVDARMLLSFHLGISIIEQHHNPPEDGDRPWANTQPNDLVAL